MPKETKETEARETPKGVGLDIGTMHLCAARRTSDGKTETKKLRDAFLDLPLDSKKMLRLSKTSFVEKDDSIIIIGDAAINTANILGKEVRRPLQSGLISASEHDAFGILSIMVESLLGKPTEPGEVVYYSVPAAPIDRPGQTVHYHESIFKRIVESLGYEAHPMNEALAVCYSETAEEGFSGLCFSFGAGMVNVSLSLNTLEAMAFSVARSGDWIDQQAGQAIGQTASRMAIIKEKEFQGEATLTDPFKGDPKNARAREAISVFYRGLIDYALTHIINEFKRVEGSVQLPNALPCIVSGGTAMPKGFVDIFNEVLKSKKGFPLDISEVRLASDPLMAVSKGLLVAAQAHE